ncbi:MAG: hypothetical protein RMH77_04200 [Sulfolobales archaeon]|nr:hypothetical protein [Sulfolobales archaeon]MDW7969590.1 hypothetical protein [Sulfolobales archaeon]
MGLTMSLCRLVHPNARTFMTLLYILGNVADEAELTMSIDNAIIRALDPARISMVEITIPSSSFIEYNVSKELSVGLNLTSLVKSIPKPKKSERVTVAADEEFYEFILEGDIVKRYRFRSIEVSPTNVPELNLDFQVRALTLSSALRDVIKELEGSDSIEFIAESAESIVLKASDLNAQAKLSKSGGSLIELELKEPAKSVYDSDYLMKIADLLSISDVIELKYGSELPLSISFKLADETLIKYLLAPKA